MITFSYYEVHESYDRDSHVVARFINKSDAEQFRAESKNSVYMSVSSERSMTVLDSVAEYAELKKANLRSSALSKLTKEEREVLGL